MSSYSFADLKSLWQQAGGSAIVADMAAAVAMAESGGDPNATNTNSDGSTDRGLWQINSVHGSQSTTDPLANAKAAVQISSNGSNWRPWCTTWSGPCTGSYLDSSAPVMKYLPSGSNTGITTASTSSGSVQNADWLDNLNPSKWASAFLTPIGRWFFYGLMTLGGITLAAGAVLILLNESKTAKTVRGLVVSAASKGAVKGGGKSKSVSKTKGDGE